MDYHDFGRISNDGRPIPCFEDLDGWIQGSDPPGSDRERDGCRVRGIVDNHDEVITLVECLFNQPLMSLVKRGKFAQS